MPRRSQAVRLRNARIATAARVHHFGPHSPVPFVCECEDDDCREFVTLPLSEYDALRGQGAFLVAAGHTAPHEERRAVS